MRRAAGALGALRLRGRFKEAPGWGRARAAGGPADPEPSVRLEHEGGDLRARAQPGLERAVSDQRSRGHEGKGGPAARPQPGLALCSGAGGVAAPGPAALSQLNALWDWRRVSFGPHRRSPNNGVRSSNRPPLRLQWGGPARLPKSLCNDNRPWVPCLPRREPAGWSAAGLGWGG